MPASTPTFAVVITTYKRPQLALRSVKSALHQSIPPYRIILVNDSPLEDYSELETFIKSKSNIVYIRNAINSGKNFSVNKALEYLEDLEFDGYIVFLDDDDWLDPSCLESFSKEIHHPGFPTWLVSNRATDTKVLTCNITGRATISYYLDALLTKRFSGDATHCVFFPKVKHARFPAFVKNGEEWVYFSQIAKYSPHFNHLPVTGTYSEGYLPGGLTAHKKTKKEKFRLFVALCKEIENKKIFNFFTAIYMILRFIKMYI